MINKPTLFSYTVKDRKNRKAIWDADRGRTAAGTASAKLDALPIDFDGRIVLAVAKAKETGRSMSTLPSPSRLRRPVTREHPPWRSQKLASQSDPLLKSPTGCNAPEDNRRITGG
jgi:hypothetical protein